MFVSSNVPLEQTGGILWAHNSLAVLLNLCPYGILGHKSPNKAIPDSRLTWAFHVICHLKVRHSDSKILGDVDGEG